MYSRQSIQWLKYRELIDNVRISHGANARGEIRIPGTKYFADGQSGSGSSVILYEFFGCVIHSCMKCFPYDRNTMKNPINGKTLEKTYEEVVIKENKLKSLGYKVLSIWACEFEILVKSKPAGLEGIMLEYEHVGRLDARESFFGGRTNSIKLHHKSGSDEQIKYFDFTSLYPWANKYARYPLGHTLIVTEDFKPIQEYFGIARVTIEPPTDLYHPVLPIKYRGKLLFPLCKNCATNELPPPCTCTQAQSVLTGTWCSPEILKAIEKGYTLIKIHEVYHFPETTQYDTESGSGGLFADYINTFLKLKQQSSGWPKECTTRETKDRYVQEYATRERIHLDPQSIESNPALRTIAKSLLTNLCGKLISKSYKIFMINL